MTVSAISGRVGTMTAAAGIIVKAQMRRGSIPSTFAADNGLSSVVQSSVDSEQGIEC